MKILSLGLDKSAAKINSTLARRLLDLSQLVEKYWVIVPAEKDEVLAINEKVKVFLVGGRQKVSKFFRIWQRAKEILSLESFDVLTTQDIYFLAGLGLFLAKRFNLGLEIQVHGFEKYYGLRKYLAQYVLPKADAIRCVSQRLKKELMDKFHIAEEKITVASIYTDGQKFSSLKRQKPPKSAGDEFIFLTVGRLVPVKNIGLQIEAISEVVKKYSEIELWVVGSGPEEEKIKTKIEKLGLGDKVKLLGQKSPEDLEKIYVEADAFLLTSDYEGWGMAIIEAASFALPIIMTDVGCAGEVIKDKENGLIIPVGDKEKLVEAMIRIIEDEKLAQEIGTGASLAIKNLLSKEQTLQLYKASWEKAMKNKKGNL